MKTKIRLALCGLAVLTWVDVGWHAFAAPVREENREPKTTGRESMTHEEAADNATDVAPPTSGHVLVLENGRTLQGDIEREGSQYRVRRSIGETWVPGDKVIRLCANLEEAYDFLRRQANLRDPDERMRLARWCQEHELRDQAMQEVAAAVELRPHNAEYHRLLQSMERAAADKKEDRGARIEDRQSAGSSHPDPRSSPPPVDLTAGAVSQFITKVQPVLMNTCAGCHGAAHAGPFQLEKVVDNGTVSRRATQHNLAHVLAQINTDNVSASPFLTKAVSIHGEGLPSGQPPIKNREAAAYHRLEDWVKQTLENNPQLRERSASNYSGEPGAEGRPATGGPPKQKKTEDAEAGSPLSQLPPVQKEATEFAVTQPPPPKNVAQPTMPTDPFDPIIFNRQAHPEKP